MTSIETTLDDQSPTRAATAAAPDERRATMGGTVTVDDRPTKTCPDCAEEVLEGARKCRFCGYRFDGADPEAGRAPYPGDEPGLLGGLLMRRKPVTTTAQQIIAAAGVGLATGERVCFFRFGRVNGLDGIVVVTDTRLFLLEVAGRRHRPRFENELVHVLGAEVSRRLGRTRLEVRCAGGETLDVTGLKRSELLELHERVQPS